MELKAPTCKGGISLVPCDLDSERDTGTLVPWIDIAQTTINKPEL